MNRIPSRSEVFVAERTTGSPSCVCFVSPRGTSGSLGRAAGTGFGQAYGVDTAGLQVGSVCTATTGDALGDAVASGLGAASLFPLVQPVARSTTAPVTRATRCGIRSG